MRLFTLFTLLSVAACDLYSEYPPPHKDVVSQPIPPPPGAQIQPPGSISPSLSDISKRKDINRPIPPPPGAQIQPPGPADSSLPDIPNKNVVSQLPLLDVQIVNLPLGVVVDPPGPEDPLSEVSNINKNVTAKVVCHLGKDVRVRSHEFLNFMNVSEIDNHLCSHVIVSYITIDKNRQIRIADVKEEEIYKYMNKLKSLQERNVKVMWSWGGLIENIGILPSILRDKQTRLELINALVTWIKFHGWDGLNLDWRYTRLLAGDNYTHLILLYNLKIAFGEADLLLSIDTPANFDPHDVLQIIKYVDWINLRTFDINSELNKLHLLAPLYSETPFASSNLRSVDDLVREWWSTGINAEKIVLGVPMTAKLYTLANPNEFYFGASSLGIPEMYSYKNICTLLKLEKWDVHWEKYQRSHWAVNEHSNQWLTWISRESFIERAKYVKYMGLGGIAPWGIGSDDYNGSCGETWPLLKAISSIIKGSGPVT